MVARSFETVRKDTGVQGVHVTTALGNERAKRKAKLFRAISSAYVQKRYASTAELPEPVRRKLKDEPKKQRQWMHVFNSAFDAHGDEARAFAEAWSAVEKRDDRVNVKIVKSDPSLGLVFGWAIISKVNGVDYYDLNVDAAGPHAGQSVPEHIPEEAMLKAAAAYAETSRPGNELHDGPDVGQYVFLFPLTTEIAKAMRITPEQTGLMVAYKPPPEVFEKFLSGKLKGFSIEGRRLAFEEHE